MSHALRVGVADQIGYFRAYNTDGSAKTDLTSSTTGLALSVFRIGAAAVSISSLSAKAADNTAHADGAIRAVSGNLYTVDLPDAACADQVPSISVKGSYTGGVIEGPEHPLIGYNPASVAVGANTIAPATPANVSDAQTAILAKLPAALESGRIAAVLDSAATAALVDLIWDEATSGHTTAGTYGGRIVRAINSNVEVQITGSNHIAADVHEFQAGVITAGDFAANSITASALATDAVTEIQSGLATAAALVTLRGADNDTLKTLSDQIDTVSADVSSIASVSREAF